MFMKRVNIGDGLKLKILRDQEYKCANTPAAKIRNMNGYKCELHKFRDGSFQIKQNNMPMCNFDHITPVKMGGTNDEHNIHALCLQCHAWKTVNDNREIRMFKKSLIRPKHKDE